jgi:hypothetical protein
MLPEARQVHIDRPVLANRVQLTQRTDRHLNSVLFLLIIIVIDMNDSFFGIAI